MSLLVFAGLQICVHNVAEQKVLRKHFQAGICTYRLPVIFLFYWKSSILSNVQCRYILFCTNPKVMGISEYKLALCYVSDF